MSGDIIGPPISAVLVPPQAERFASLVGVNPDRLVLNVTGWNKLVLLDTDRVFLFPRAVTGVEWFEREIATYRALENSQLSVVPRLLGHWEDPDIYPFPFAAVSRLRGAVPAEPENLLRQLGEAIACWHEITPPRELAGSRPPAHHDVAHQRWLRRALDPATSAEAAAEAAERLGQPGRAPAWADLLGRAAQLRPVLVHGDIHEDQLLADGDRLTGVIDWETARIDHPFFDFDFGGVGYRAVAPPPPRLQLPLDAGLACLCREARAGSRLAPARDGLPHPACAPASRWRRRSRRHRHNRGASRSAARLSRSPFASVPALPARPSTRTTLPAARTGGAGVPSDRMVLCGQTACSWLGGWVAGWLVRRP